MRWIRILVIAVALSLVGWATPDTSFSRELDNPRVKMVSKKKNPNKKKIKKVKKGQKKKKKGKRVKKRKPGKKKKKVKKKKKQGFKEPKWAVGVRGGIAPTGKMSVDPKAGPEKSYTPRLAFAAGLVTQYRVFDKPSIYILGEFSHWWHELKQQKTSKKDSLMTISTGVRVNVWGQANQKRHRVFVKGLVGYSYYAANKGNGIFKGGKGAADRSGIYFGGSLGYEYLFKALPLSVFVDTGVYNHNFLVEAKGEKESSLLTWEVGAGLLYHF